MNPYWLDTSLLLRLLTGDPPPLAEKALQVFREAEEGRLLLVTQSAHYRAPTPHQDEGLGFLSTSPTVP